MRMINSVAGKFNQEDAVLPTDATGIYRDIIAGPATQWGKYEINQTILAVLHWFSRSRNQNQLCLIKKGWVL